MRISDWSSACALPICAQYLERTVFRDVRTNLVAIRLHIVSRNNDGTRRILQLLAHIRQGSLAVFRMKQTIAFAIKAIAAQLGEAGHAPEIGGNTPIAFQKLDRKSVV